MWQNCLRSWCPLPIGFLTEKVERTLSQGAFLMFLRLLGILILVKSQTEEVGFLYPVAQVLGERRAG
jgi:hypothetical protein